MVDYHQCIFCQNKIVFPKIVKRFKRNINAVSNGIQVDIGGENESENFSLYLKKNSNLVTRNALIEWHYPNGTKQLLSLHESTVTK